MGIECRSQDCVWLKNQQVAREMMQVRWDIAFLCEEAWSRRRSKNQGYVAVLCDTMRPSVVGSFVENQV